MAIQTEIRKLEEALKMAEQSITQLPQRTAEPRKKSSKIL